MALLKRQLHLWHRWLGIAIGALVLLWFGSGIVMMYVPYPALTDGERMAWLEAPEARAITVSAWQAWQATGLPGVPDAARLSSVAGRPAYHFLAGGRWTSVWADSANLLQVSEALAAASAAAILPGAVQHAPERIDIDQWTFGRLAAHKPLYRIAFDDAAGSVLYMSGRTGELVRDTTRRERGWNWAGSVIHWLYFTPLRMHGEAWRQAVMWTSGVALALALSGMVLGIQRLRLKRRYAGGRRSPYRGWKAWHHWLGLSAGVLTLTWLFSGWLSVTPFGLFASQGLSLKERTAFAGGALSSADLSAPLAPVLDTGRGVLELEWRRVDGRLYFSVLDRSQRQLADAHSGKRVPVLPEAALRHAVQAMRPGTGLQAEMLAHGDDYYYSHHQQAGFPVLRARFDGPDEATVYVDATTGQLAAYVDRGSKWNRWLFNALHQFDFSRVMRSRPLWDITVATLCLLGAALAVTGVVLGWRRLRR